MHVTALSAARWRCSGRCRLGLPARAKGGNQAGPGAGAGGGGRPVTAAGRAPGRAAQPEAEQAILDATVELFTTRGLAGLSVERRGGAGRRRPTTTTAAGRPRRTWCCRGHRAEGPLPGRPGSRSATTWLTCCAGSAAGTPGSWPALMSRLMSAAAGAPRAGRGGVAAHGRARRRSGPGAAAAGGGRSIRPTPTSSWSPTCWWRRCSAGPAGPPPLTGGRSRRVDTVLAGCGPRIAACRPGSRPAARRELGAHNKVSMPALRGALAVGRLHRRPEVRAERPTWGPLAPALAGEGGCGGRSRRA